MIVVTVQVDVGVISRAGELLPEQTAGLLPIAEDHGAAGCRPPGPGADQLPPVADISPFMGEVLRQSWVVPRIVMETSRSVGYAPLKEGGGCVAVQAYILIQTEVGKAAQVAKEVKGISGVTAAEDVTGPYDVIVHAEARSVDDLGKLVVTKIQAVEGITRTLTCPVLHL